MIARVLFLVRVVCITSNFVSRRWTCLSLVHRCHPKLARVAADVTGHGTYDTHA